MTVSVATPVGAREENGRGGRGVPETGDSAPANRHQGLKAILYLSPGMLGFLFFIVLPLLASLVISFFNWSLYGSPEFVGIENYRRMFSGEDPAFWRVLLNTTIFGIAYTILNLLIALGISYWLQHLRESYSRVLRVIFFIPVVTPMAGNALIWRLLLSDQGVVNAALGKIGISPIEWLNDPALAMLSLLMMSLWQGLGYNIVVLTAGLNGLNTSVLEAAKIDGAGGWTRFIKVVFPMISPTVFFCTIMTVIGAFKVFAQPYFLTKGGPGESTNMMVLYLYNNGFSYDKLGYASSLAWVLFVVVMLLTALQFTQQKRWVNYDA